MFVQVQQGRTQLREWSQLPHTVLEKKSEHVGQEMWIRALRLRGDRTERFRSTDRTDWHQKSEMSYRERGIIIYGPPCSLSLLPES